EGIRERGSEADLAHTICRATRQRQEAASELAKRVDAMVVIGGRNSANTSRLAEICDSAGAKTFHIESWEEITPEWFEGCETVGVTAGASTPQYQIDEVVETLRNL
ncbi:MAG: 4-hydroxy-3-methylbut-2-enyl diphosphate reductase, partial [Eggerthellaceae bacterium]|nr:4-hydroxy-3-methylbut-2-enyl diphosphate reductase [Eggerthellaceae bacterium]